MQTVYYWLEQVKKWFVTTAAQRRSSLLFPLLGFAVLLILVLSKSGPQRVADAGKATAVQAMRVAAIPTAARVLSYGSVEADTDWRAVAEVSGRVVFSHEQLKPGATLAKNTVVLRIDPLDYELALVKAQADVASAQAKLAALDAEQKNNRIQLQIAQKSLAVAEQEFKRNQSLLKRNLTSKTQVDAQQQLYLQQQQQLQNHQVVVDTLPSRRRELQANLRLHQTRVKEAQRNLARTEVRLPFAARIAQVQVETDEFLNVSQALFSAYSMEKVEVSAQFSMEDITALLAGSEQSMTPQTLLDQNFLAQLQLTAQVKTTFNGENSQWSAKVERIGSEVDLTTRTLPIVVSVAQPYQQKTALLPGMYVQVQIQGPAKSRIAIPRSAVHNNMVYVVNAQQQLEKRKISLGFVAGDIASVSQGLQENENIVLTDLIPAVPGMRLTPEFSQNNVVRLQQLAQGELAVAGAN